MELSVAGRGVLVIGYAEDMPDPTGRPLRVLGFEPFDTGSHRAVRESISRHSRHQWTWVNRPGRAWKWRMRVAAIEMFDVAHDRGLLDEPIDIVFATSLLGLADLRAIWSRTGLPDARFVLYLHENQAAYPEGVATTESRERDAHFALTNLTSVLAADLAIFNSQWNRDSFIKGIAALLRHAPDSILGDLGPRIESSSIVLWPPVEPPPGAVGEGAVPATSSRKAIRVLWPHRWEHDKGPDELLAIARAHTESANLRWTILGESYRNVPESLDIFRREFADDIDHIGFAEDRAAYWRHVRSCDWVLSTAHHEFFGIAVVEAMLAGCLPWLPDRLSYREIIPEIAKGLSPMLPPPNPDAICAAVRKHLEPAVADHAVRRLDDALVSVVAG